MGSFFVHTGWFLWWPLSPFVIGFLLISGECQRIKVNLQPSMQFFQRQLSIFIFTLNYPPIRNNLTSASLLWMLIETDYLNYPSNQKQSFICKSAIVLRRRNTKDTKQYLIKCFRSMTMASLLSMLIETDYNFKKITAVFLRVLFKTISFCLELPVYKTKRKTFST